MAEAFQQLEEADAIRLSWNVWPNSRLEATKSVVPFGALYTPIKRLQNMPVSWHLHCLIEQASSAHCIKRHILCPYGRTMREAEVCTYQRRQHHWVKQPGHSRSAIIA